MRKIKRFTIMIALLLLVFSLTGFERPGIHKDTANIPIETLPIDQAKMLEEIGGVNFGHLVLFDSISGETKLLKRIETNKYNEYRYKTDHVSEPKSASAIRKVSTYSVIGVEVNDTNYSSCNIININGIVELLCKKSDGVGYGVYDEVSNLPDNILADLPATLASKLETLGGNTVKEIGFVILSDIQDGTLKLLKHENYEIAPLSLLDSVKELTRTSTSTLVTFKKNPCCVRETDSSGTSTLTCDIFARSC